MKRVIIFGATDTGKRIFHMIRNEYVVEGFVDGNPKLWGTLCEGFTVCNYERLLEELTYDYVIIGVLSSARKCKKLLIDMGIDEYKIIDKYVEIPTQARINFLENAAQIIYNKNMKGAVAEAGVYQGDFAKYMNQYFIDRKCYLFDTFEGLPEVDLKHDNEQGYSMVKAGHFADSSIENVMAKMKYPKQCIVKKGYFPETADKIEDVFCFVNLDMDLYQPTLEGLKWFYPRMVRGGYLVIHDYFSTAFGGVKKAVDEYANENNLFFAPVGDTLSIVFVKVQE